MPRTRPPYPPEFRAEAVRLAKTSGEPIARIATDLGISDQTLRNWVNQDDVDAGRKSGLTSDERARMRELEKENRKLREEREILREAAASFAAETGHPEPVTRPRFPVHLIRPRSLAAPNENPASWIFRNGAPQTPLG